MYEFFDSRSISLLVANHESGQLALARTIASPLAGASGF